MRKFIAPLITVAALSAAIPAHAATFEAVDCGQTIAVTFRNKTDVTKVRKYTYLTENVRRSDAYEYSDRVTLPAHSELVVYFYPYRGEKVTITTHRKVFTYSYLTIGCPSR